jgi:hypothetical protein
MISLTDPNVIMISKENKDKTWRTGVWLNGKVLA